MKWTGLNELREKYLQFFESKGHLRLPSFSLVPNGDKSLLLINSGMAPMKKYFTGEVTPPRNRVTTCQKCIRTPDIERVALPPAMVLILKCWEISLLEIILSMRLPLGLGSSAPRCWSCLLSGFGFPFTRMTTRLSTFGPRRSGWIPAVLSGWEKKIISGSMAPAPAALAPSFILTGVRNMDAVLRPAGWDATATGTWNFGTWFSPSLITTARETIRPWSIKTSIPVWGWNAWPALCKVWITCSWSIRCRIS